MYHGGQYYGEWPPSSVEFNNNLEVAAGLPMFSMKLRELAGAGFELSETTLMRVSSVNNNLGHAAQFLINKLQQKSIQS